MQKYKSSIGSIAAMAITFALLLGGATINAAPKGTAQKKCPVMSGSINKNIFVDYKGYRIYFCCSGCDSEFKSNPEKYLQKMKEQGVVPEKSPKA